MVCAPEQCVQGFSDEERAVLSEVAAAMRMTADEFLTSEVQGTTPDEARGYLKAFVVHATDAQIRTIYYLTRALTEKGAERSNSISK